MMSTAPGTRCVPLHVSDHQEACNGLPIATKIWPGYFKEHLDVFTKRITVKTFLPLYLETEVPQIMHRISQVPLTLWKHCRTNFTQFKFRILSIWCFTLLKLKLTPLVEKTENRRARTRMKVLWFRKAPFRDIPLTSDFLPRAAWLPKVFQPVGSRADALIPPICYSAALWGLPCFSGTKPWWMLLCILGSIWDIESGHILTYSLLFYPSLSLCLCLPVSSHPALPPPTPPALPLFSLRVLSQALQQEEP